MAIIHLINVYNNACLLAVKSHLLPLTLKSTLADINTRKQSAVTLEVLATQSTLLYS